MVGSVSEGCADLGSGLEGVQMTMDGVIVIEEAGPEESAVRLKSASEEIKQEVTQSFNHCVCVFQPRDPAELSCSVRALQQDIEELKRVNSSLQKENHSLREQLTAARSGNSSSAPLRSPWKPKLHSSLTLFALPVCVRRGGAGPLHTSQLRRGVCALSEGLLPQHDLGPG